jgi:hypothetical protein
LDSQILVYAGVAPSNPSTQSHEFKQLKTRSLVLIDELAQNDAACIIATIVLAELLVYVPPNRRGDFTAALSAQYVLAPFDLRASTIATDLWTAYRANKGLPQKERPVLRVDCMIVGSARAAGATDFFSHDDACRELAKLAGMQAHDLPEISSSMTAAWIAADLDSGMDVPATTRALKGRRQRGRPPKAE